jgi:spore photoproduct lyase
VVYPGFERDYELMIEEISRTIDLKRVIWVSLGMLRFPKKLFDLLLEEKRKNLLSGEFVRGEDGKFRYLKKDRIRAYRILYDHLKEKENNLFIYLCMERADVWKEVTGEELINDEDLVRKFDERIRFLYGGEI